MLELADRPLDCIEMLVHGGGGTSAIAGNDRLEHVAMLASCGCSTSAQRGKGERLLLEDLLKVVDQAPE